ncbi:MAG TPA: PQQ-dependent sugar dehydrogenase [Sphingomonas sp.]|nr:PQQ-dependent sugar dehydrogenase [Sphingomonas sp.]
MTATTVATLTNPWAMVFLPDGRMLVSERTGSLRVVTQAGDVGAPLTGVPAVDSSGQGGLLDVALDPDFATNNRVYISYSEPGSGGTAGTAVARGTLSVNASGVGSLAGLTVIWRQTPKVVDSRHYGARMAFGPDGKLYITAGERHQGAPAQDLTVTLGKIVRINSDGTIPADNPFVGTVGAQTEIWSLGHRNPYGLVFGTDGRLFESEMGPDAGDEFNIITKGANYGWRVVAEGSDGGVPLPPHSTHPEFAAPAEFWNPNIAPAGMIQYTGSRFVDWGGDFVLAGLVSQGLVQVHVAGTTATEVRRIALGQRIREVEQGPDGAIWILEDGAAGRLRKLVPSG